MSEQNERPQGSGDRHRAVRIRRNSHPVLTTVGLVAPPSSNASRTWTRRGWVVLRGSW